ncbi:MAG: glycoside hydrolase [Erysipelotrichaceae bacterium]|nr:glycoside hydrolase [Erysipelotrichaceae bacterium]
MHNLFEKTTNHLYPFLWVHGSETDEEYIEEIEKINQCGCGALCIEARPHNDFNGPKWFHDLGLIIGECKKRGMKVWILDDSHFPTGFANGKIKTDYPQYKKKYLCLKTFDVAGPMEQGSMILKYVLKSPKDKILGIYLQKRLGFEEIDTDYTIDVTSQTELVDDYNTGKPLFDLIGNPIPGAVGGPCLRVNLDIPEGTWSLNVVFVSEKGGEKETENHLNPLDAKATRVLLQEVYEPIYEHFGEEFGKTVTGFFSDEPRFGNLHGAENASIGRNSEMVLPYAEGLEQMLAEKADVAEIGKELPLLFIGSSQKAKTLRYHYMDLVSALYSENFDGVLGDWCKAHHVMRVGHTIEDNNAVARLGYGPGHFFRSMKHADMAGIDVVLFQLVPEFDDAFKSFHKPNWDGEFFTYVLGKLGSSLAHLNPRAKGNSMCELFGAYGWQEGNKLAKWMTDYMLVRGINNLVPHAFSPKAFPDSDCPPHFYAKGNNPQYPEFKQLMNYANRLCHLLSDGQCISEAGILFHGEAEWSGDYMFTQVPAKELTTHQIGFEIVSADYLNEGHFDNGTWNMNGQKIRCLIVPYAENLPAQVLVTIRKMQDGGLPVCFMNGLPTGTSEGTVNNIVIDGNVLRAEQLADTLQKAGLQDIHTDCECPKLRVHHYVHDGLHLYFFVNESSYTRVQTTVTVKETGYITEYDAFTDTLVQDDKAFTLDLPPYGSKMVIVSDEPLADAKKEYFTYEPVCDLTCADVVLTDFEGHTKELAMNPVVYINTVDSSFCGRITYTFTVNCEEGYDGKAEVLGATEGIRVLVNGKECGVRICPDYTFDVSFAQGHNELTVEANTTLARSINDYISQFMPLGPTGIKGVRIYRKKQ